MGVEVLCVTILIVCGLVGMGLMMAVGHSEY